MKKFHIGKNGPKECKAHKRPCPLGENTPHFDSKEKAQSFFNENEKNKNGVLSKIDNNLKTMIINKKNIIYQNYNGFEYINLDSKFLKENKELQTKINKELEVSNYSYSKEEIDYITNTIYNKEVECRLFIRNNDKSWCSQYENTDFENEEHNEILNKSEKFNKLKKFMSEMSYCSLSLRDFCVYINIDDDVFLNISTPL